MDWLHDTCPLLSSRISSVHCKTYCSKLIIHICPAYTYMLSNARNLCVLLLRWVLVITHCFVITATHRMGWGISCITSQTFVSKWGPPHNLTNWHYCILDFSLQLEVRWWQLRQHWNSLAIPHNGKFDGGLQRIWHLMIAAQSRSASDRWSKPLFGLHFANWLPTKWPYKQLFVIRLFSFSLTIWSTLKWLVLPHWKPLGLLIWQGAHRPWKVLEFK